MRVLEPEKGLEDNTPACGMEMSCELIEKLLGTDKKQLEYLESFEHSSFKYSENGVFERECFDILDEIDKQERNEALQKLLVAYKGASKKEIKEAINSLLDI